MELNELTSYGISAASLLFAAYAYFRPRSPKKRLGFRSQNFALVHDAVAAVPNLEVRYLDADVSRLTVAKFWIWNSCGAAVARADVYEKEPLKVVVASGKILHAERVEAESQPSQRRADVIVLPDGTARISLELLNDGEQVGFTLIHSGEARNDHVRLQGTLIGGGHFAEGDPPRHRQEGRRIMAAAIVVTILLGALFFYFKIEYLVGMVIWIVPMIGAAFALSVGEGEISDLFPDSKTQE